MKTLTLIIIAIAAVAMAGCHKAAVTEDIPACIASTIKQNEGNQDWPFKRIDEYQYQGQLVYFFEPITYYADMTATISTKDCNALCYLGGLRGNVMCNGDKFSEKAIFKRTVWEKK